MTMPAYSGLDLVLLALAVLYGSHVITRLDGPFGLFARMRARWPHGPLHCRYCVGFWLAVGLFFSHLVLPGLTWVLAAVGLAMLLYSHTGMKFDGAERD